MKEIWRDTLCKGYLRNTEVLSECDTYLYRKIPCSLDVQIMTLLSADPEAKCLPGDKHHNY